MDTSKKHLHEQFVRNPFGCGVIRTFAFVLQTLICLFIVRLLSMYLDQKKLRFSKSLLFIIENVIVFGWMVLSTTIWASFYWHLLLFIVVAFVVAIVMVRQNLPFVAENKSHSDQTAYSKLTIYSSLKCHVICSTIAMILAVDFPIFPREFAKTERFGLSIMDVGAIFFVALNSAVSIEIRCEQYLKGWSAMIKTIKSCLPLITIGLIRLVVVKALDYHESVSEYGVHLNFFLLLAIVKILSSLLHLVFSSHNLVLLSVGFISFYEMLLKWKLSSYIQADNVRYTWIDQNKEGLFCIPNLVAFNLLFQQATRPIHASRHLTTERFVRTGLVLHYTRLATIAAVAAFISHFLVDPISRRNCNVAFLTTILTFLFFLMATEYAFELLLINLFGVHRTLHSTSSLFLKVYSNRGLTLFLLANLLTGAINLLMDTTRAASFTSLSVISLYLASVSTYGYMVL